MRITLIATFLCLAAGQIAAQTETDSLPTQSGAMVLDLSGLKVTQRSAKPDGREIGVRAHAAAHIELLAFLFLTPGQKAQTPATCLAQDIKPVMKANPKLKEQLNPLGRDDGAAATTLLTDPNGGQVLYKYAGAEDQCLLVQVSADNGSQLDLPAASALLDRQRFDADYSPKLEDASRYQAIRGNQLLAGKASPEHAPRMLVGWYAPGGVVLPADPDWKLELFTVYDKGARPAIEFKNEKTHVIASFLISENSTGKATAESCRDDVMEGIRKIEGELISNPTTGTMVDGQGNKFATASHLSRLVGGAHNRDVFAFAGNAKTCAEIHLSTVSGEADEEKRLADALKLFHPDLSYQPTCADYMPEASAFYKQSPITGAPFYDACLKTIPPGTTDAGLVETRRIATDQIVIALGMTGNVQRSRAYAERAIKQDPDYPLNYYNLACADAELGKEADAKVHLQQAFDRRANTIKGETLPDPTKDDSILKLKKNKEFWAFVQGLPKN